MPEIGDQTLKMEVFLKEMGKLMNKLGLEGAIKHLQALNVGDIGVLDGIALYQFIIRTVMANFSITEKQLLEKNKHFVTRPARMTAYYLIAKYVDCQHSLIASQFQKKRSTITVELMHFSNMMADRNLPSYRDHFEKHDKAEAEVIEFIKTMNIPIDNMESGGVVSSETVSNPVKKAKKSANQKSKKA